ncbi:MAG: CoA pyrophosphatase [Weeksellaceae bacterium]|jgi:8-oxo-dGTP pyrophosphatase MutT (NUDIX family)|nr:CoA pyrophosphatase [Weeksellaceae bacterium]
MDLYIDELKYKLTHFEGELPGWESQQKLSPPYRDRFDIESVKKANPRAAAVLIMLYENDDGDIEFPVTLRQIYQGVHSNQISLPGGAFEPEDIELSRTAVRETCEELGVYEEDIEIALQLTELYIPPSNFLVYPFVGFYKGVPNFDIQSYEVQQVVPLDLGAFLRAESLNFEREFGGHRVEIPGYDLGENEYIWGATAMILSEFADLTEML